VPTIFRLLLGVVDRDFRVSYFKIKNGIQPIALSENNKKRKAKAMEISVERAMELITERLEEQKVILTFFATRHACLPPRNQSEPPFLTAPVHVVHGKVSYEPGTRIHSGSAFGEIQAHVLITQSTRFLASTSTLLKMSTTFSRLATVLTLSQRKTMW